MWRFLSEQLPFFEKRDHETWKAAYLRCWRRAKHLTRENFNYEMCPIRHFRQHVVKLLDCYSNFVLAVDAAGSFAVFWIDYEDLENDEDTLQTEGVSLNGEEPIAIYTFPADKAPVGRP